MYVTLPHNRDLQLPVWKSGVSFRRIAGSGRVNVE